MRSEVEWSISSQYTTLHFDTLFEECRNDVILVLIAGEKEAEISKKVLSR